MSIEIVMTKTKTTKRRATTSMKRDCVVFGMIILLASSLFNGAECRTLRSDSTINKSSHYFFDFGCDKAVKRADSEILSNSNSSSGTWSLMFILASGPSKRGKGH